MLAKTFGKLQISIIFIAVAFVLGEVSTPQPLSPPMNDMNQVGEGKIEAGGDEADPHSIPYIALVVLTTDEQKRKCGGVIMDKYNVITVASCMDSDKPWEYMVIAGLHNTSELFSLPLALQIRTGRKLIRHPDFKKLKGNLSRSDIGLIHLNTPLKFNKYVNSSKLPTKVKEFNGTEAEISGWGIKGFDKDNEPMPRDALFKNEIDLLNNSICKKKVLKHVGNGIYDKNMLCGNKNQHSICAGDEGGPMTVDGVLEGLSNYPLKKQCNQTYSLYTRVAKFTDWLEDNKATSTGSIIHPLFLSNIWQQVLFFALLKLPSRMSV